MQNIESQMCGMLTVKMLAYDLMEIIALVARKVLKDKCGLNKQDERQVLRRWISEDASTDRCRQQKTDRCFATFDHQAKINDHAMVIQILPLNNQ